MDLDPDWDSLLIHHPPGVLQGVLLRVLAHNVGVLGKIPHRFFIVSLPYLGLHICRDINSITR